jgi:hypothetical protein
MTVTATITGIDALVSSLSKLSSRVVSGVKTTDELNYIKALVWDMGYVNRVIEPGPKTLWSVNTLGEEKVLTITAPTGFIRIRRNTYLAILKDEFTKANFAGRPLADWEKLATSMMTNAAQRCAVVVANGAPIDKGDLRASIVAAAPGDEALGGTGYGVYGTLDLDMSHFLEE